MKSVIPYTFLSSKAVPPTHNKKGDAGLDFYSAQSYTIVPANGYALVQTGVRINLPVGAVGLLFPKGSNDYLLGAGVIDTYYEGEVIFKVVNFTNKDIGIHYGKPIGQMVIVPFTEPLPIYYQELESRNSERKDSGGIMKDIPATP